MKKHDVSKIKIESGIEMPDRKHGVGKWLEIFSMMNDGDSFLLPNTETESCNNSKQYLSLKCSAYAQGHQISGRSTEEGIRVWMVKKNGGRE